MKTPLKKSIAEIKQQHIQPDARWKYLAKKYFLWVSFLLLAGCAALCTAVVYHLLVELDWDLYHYQNRSLLLYGLSIAPWVWALPLGAVLLVAFWNIRKTESGYRFRFGTVALISLGISFGLAGVFAAFGYGQLVNGTLMHQFPAYQHSVTTKEAQWSQPENGFLSGTISSFSDRNIDIEDLQGNDWQLILNEETIIRPAATIENGSKIKAIGTQTDEDTFTTNEIRPWEGRGKMMQQHQKQDNSQGRQCKGSCGKNSN